MQLFLICYESFIRHIFNTNNVKLQNSITHIPSIISNFTPLGKGEEEGKGGKREKKKKEGGVRQRDNISLKYHHRKQSAGLLNARHCTLVLTQLSMASTSPTHTHTFQPIPPHPPQSQLIPTHHLPLLLPLRPILLLLFLLS